MDRLAVFCDDSAHEGPVELATMTRAGGVRWFAPGLADVLLAGDAVIPATAPAGSVPDDTRSRHALRCHCGANLVWRDGTLDPILNRLVDGGVSRVSLAGLNRLISTQA